MTATTDWTDSTKAPRTKECPVPVYCYGWISPRTNARKGDWAISRIVAQDSVDALRAAGLTVWTCTRWTRARLR